MVLEETPKAARAAATPGEFGAYELFERYKAEVEMSATKQSRVRVFR